MKIRESSYLPAAAIGAGVLLPSFLPWRRRLTFALVTAAGMASVGQSPDAYRPVTISDIQALTLDQEQLLNDAAAGGVVAVAALPAIGLVRLLPVPRVLGAAALAGAYLVADSYLQDWVADRSASRADDDSAAGGDSAGSDDSTGAGDDAAHPHLRRAADNAADGER